jgi:parallel beta-helix repeat protein
MRVGVLGCAILVLDISGFLRGVRLRSAEGNTVLDNLIHDNGDVTRHVGYGIDLAAGAKNNLLRGNTTTSNGDEGIHFGSGSGGNDFIDNAVFDNHREQIYRLIGGRSLVRIAKVENGVERVLASARVPNPARGVFFRLRGEASATGWLSLELDGVPKLSVSESGFATGSPGVLIGGVSGRVAHRVDNFSASVP